MGRAVTSVTAGGVLMVEVSKQVDMPAVPVSSLVGDASQGAQSLRGTEPVPPERPSPSDSCRSRAGRIAQNKPLAAGGGNHVVDAHVVSAENSRSFGTSWRGTNGRITPEKLKQLTDIAAFSASVNLCVNRMLLGRRLVCYIRRDEEARAKPAASDQSATN